MPLCVWWLYIFPFSCLNAQLPFGFKRDAIVDRLNPTSMTVAPDGRVFVLEKHGVIHIVRNDELLEEPFLTLEVDDSNERGLGHMVFHPDFETNGYFYIYYSVPGLEHNRISRFTANGDHTIPGSETVIIELDKVSGQMHNGGAMLFGQDGYLYVATGDGGENWRGEDLGATSSKVLRMDPEGHPVPDNPWYNFAYLRANLVYAHGFRNPYTMTMHPLTGEIYVNDVGAFKFEEVNRIERGGFYGWPRVEGKRIQQVVSSEYRDPLFQYTHDNGYCAIVGSVFYLPEVRQFPEPYQGLYFYSDYCTGHIRMLDVNTGQDKGVFISDGDRVIDLDISRQGDLYYLERRGIGDGTAEDNTQSSEGVLWKVSYTGSGAPLISQPLQDILVSEGETATFSVTASGLHPLSYQWYIDGQHIDTTEGPVLEIQNVSISLDSARVHVKISNALDTVTADTAWLWVTSNQRPLPEIITPADGQLYNAGDRIEFKGSAQDLEDGILSADALSWRIDFHHGTHSHPAMSWTSGITMGTWEIPSVGETSTDVWYRIYLKATDDEGLSKLIYRDILPALGTIEVKSDPEGLVIALDGVSRMAPYSIEGVKGVNRYITPPYKQVRGDSVYFFEAWADGILSINREVRASSQNQELVGRFQSSRNGTGTGLTVYYFNNTAFEGEPIAGGVDSAIVHNYLFKGPVADMPEDHFGILWKGYIQPYRSGHYQFAFFADDGIFMQIDRQVILQNWNAGFKYEKGSMYMEAGRLYPIEIRFNELMWNAQISFRWSCEDFPEEVVPTSQLYPMDVLTHETSSGVYRIEEVTSQELRLLTESFVDTRLDFMITSVSGLTVSLMHQEIPAGRKVHSININLLPPGLYYFTAKDAVTGTTATTPFLKI